VQFEFNGKIQGDMNSKDGRTIRFMDAGKPNAAGAITIQNTVGGMMQQFGRGGPGGGGGGPGGGGMRGMGGDPNQMFNMLSKGKDVINRSDLEGWQQMMFDRMAPQMGITNGQVTRAQFQQASEMMRSRMQGAGGPGGGFGGAGGGMSPEQMDRFSEDRFRRADTNGDGLLQVNEMSERMRPVWEKFDTNHDGAIDLNEFKSYMRSVFQEGQSGRTAEAQPPASVAPMIPVPDSGSPAEEEDRRPTVFRAGKLPKDIPGWFEQLDTDRDGQIGLYEWVKADRSIDEFRAMDRNEDGFLTIDEIMVYVRAKNPGGSQGESVAIAGPMNGFNAFGGSGMQFSDNGQDNRGRPGRRGENGRSPGGGMGMRGPNGGNNGGGRPDMNWLKGRAGENGNNGGGNSFGGPGGRRGGGDNSGYGGGPGGRRGDNAKGRPDNNSDSPPADARVPGGNGGGRNNRRNQDGE